ncbi:hypothetical protein AB0K00_18945 [Dactylosporangium sp. NPDC049525]|uniref:hypothetical protein n=1 Tax=Dactylosporangium sp. NPDC049525 TaxID=3154730 RepID=UPI003418B5CA
MPTLRIEHAIVDFALWRRAFDTFAEARDKAGVLRHRVMRPVDDEHYVAIDLDFPTAQAAEAFERFLRTTVWSDPQRAPALDGTPSTRIFETADD